MISKNHNLETPAAESRPPFGPIKTVEIAICTWNRKSLLEKTLGSIKRLIVPFQIQLRVIVVDNASTDGTADLLQQFASDEKFTRRHKVVLLQESEQGHTHARNRAIEELEGDLLIWTDDDVLLDAFLVQRYVEFADANRNTAFFGGKIEADFEVPPDPWIRENWQQLKGCFAERDLGEEPMPFTGDRLPYGANFAIRRAVQQQFPFDVELGRQGDIVNGEDELEMMRRVLESGLEGQWVPEASVKHFIDQSRVTETWIRDYFVGQGRMLVAKGEAWSESSSRLRWRSLLRFMAYRFKRQYAPSPQWVSLMLESSLAAGQAMELAKRQQSLAAKVAGASSGSAE